MRNTKIRKQHIPVYTILSDARLLEIWGENCNFFWRIVYLKRRKRKEWRRRVIYILCGKEKEVKYVTKKPLHSPSSSYACTIYQTKREEPNSLHFPAIFLFLSPSKCGQNEAYLCNFSKKLSLYFTKFPQ